MFPLDLIQAENVLAKSMELAEKDPHGWIITLVSISVVFISLALLFVLYFLFGRLINFVFKEKKQVEQEVVKEESRPVEVREPHDSESYVLTIRKKDNINIRSLAPIAIKSGVILVKTTSNTITAPLPGVITSVKVKEGEIIKAGQVVAVLEAMKMENDLQAERDGRVKEVKVEKGDSVLEGAVIITIE
jgi:biotin carboxyl carrier protein